MKTNVLVVDDDNHMRIALKESLVRAGYNVALAEDGKKAYFVLLISPPDEHEVLYEQLFLPAVEALVPLE